MTTSLPVYHPFDDTFINDPNSFKFRFTSVQDLMTNSLDHEIGCIPVATSHSKKKTRSLRVRYENTKNPVRERTIPQVKKKKRPTKPKDNSKINKMKRKNEIMRF